MHIVIGKGNLGMDLAKALTLRGHQVKIFTKSEGFEWPESEPAIRNLDPSHVWVTAGHGSVNECNADFSGALATHVALPMDLARILPNNVRIGTFSTDYVAHPEVKHREDRAIQVPQTLYAQSKLWMEQGLKNLRRPLIAVFRVGSLYGNHLPEKTFPGRLKAKYPAPCELNLPDNIVVPTPTWWIAQKIVENLDLCFDRDKLRMHHVAPMGNVTTRGWGQLILGEGYRIHSSGIDPLRPAHTGLGCSFDRANKTTWKELWDSGPI